MKQTLLSKFLKIKRKWLQLSLKQKLLFPFFAFIVLPFFLIISIYLLTGIGLVVNLPTSNEIRNITKPIASKIYANDGQNIGSFYIENREYLNRTQVNFFFKNALVAAEDHRFYSHNGIDYRSLLRVFLKTILLQKDASGGGSTITQQLVKNLFPRMEYKVFSLLLNKFREMHIAQRLEKIYSKEDILWMYASTVSFGEQAFGLSTSSKRFFNKKPENLLLEEAALLVGMLKATSYYSPRKHPERARLRRNLVLQLMVKNGYLRPSGLENILDKDIQLDYQSPSDSQDFARYFKQYLIKEFELIMTDFRKPDGSKYSLYKDGIKLYTSLDKNLQINALKIRKSHMKRLQKLFESSWKSGPIFGKNNSVIDANIRRNKEYLVVKEKGYGVKQTLDSFNIEKQMSFWSWDGDLSKKTSRIDSIKHYLKLLHSSVLAANPENGQIFVWIGGNDYSKFQFDNILARRQVGSLFKPFAYLAALKSGKDVCDFYKNDLIKYKEYKDWTPKNANSDYGGYLSMNEALAHSVNTISVQVLFDAGIENVIQIARSLGIDSPLAAVPSLVLGTSDVSLFEMITAYARIANGSKKVELNAIQKIEDRNGNVLYERDFIYDDLEIDVDNIEKLRAMMFKVSREGTARKIYKNYNISSVIISKTGTTQNQSDGWYVASSKNFIAGAWVGTEDRRMHFPNLSSGAGSQTALPLVGSLFEYASQKGYLKSNLNINYDFDCPNALSDEQYVVFKEQEKLDSLFENNDDYGGWLKKIFNKKRNKKSLNDKYSEYQIKKQIRILKEERLEQMNKIDDEIKAWKKKLEDMSEHKES